MKPLKILALPRDVNPYQELLYGPVHRLGAHVRYGACRTRSRLINLLLLPVELLVARLAGFSVLHLHWVFGFSFPGPANSRLRRRLSRSWFEICLRWAQLLGYKVVWTAHNVLPHEPVFDDDARGRRFLVQRADLVLAHNANALRELTALAGPPRRARVLPLGAVAAPGQFAGIGSPGGRTPRRGVFFGRIAPYKGVEQLIDSADELEGALVTTIAGDSRDENYSHILAMRAARCADGVVTLRLGYIPDDELVTLLESSDVLIFPFRTVTTSSSVFLGMAAGRLVVIPDLPAFTELTGDGVLKYPEGGLTDALRGVTEMPLGELVARGDAARRYATDLNWDDLGATTFAELASLHEGGHTADTGTKGA